MRLLLVSRFAHRVGGIEIYLGQLIPALSGRGCEVAVLSEGPPPPGSDPLVSSELPAWNIEESGDVVAAVRSWNPDVLFMHDSVNLGVMRRLADQYPSVWFAHGYEGLCVSGTRCWKTPVPRPCPQRVGWPCLLHFYPHRCGGLNPLTIWKLFRQQQTLISILRGFDLVLTHSEYVRSEFLRNEFDPASVRIVPFPVRGERRPRRRLPDRISEGPLCLIYAGRFDELKGGGLLIKALAPLSQRLSRPVELTMAGEGPAMSAWRDLAGREVSRTGSVKVDFSGWLTGEARLEALASADLLVVPSVWPEPFGMTGIEAGYFGIPSVAFEVGGIPTWLKPGANGELAPGGTPTVGGLLEAMARAVQDPAHYVQLCAGALEATGRFGMDSHLQAIEAAFKQARENRASGRPGAGGGS